MLQGARRQIVGSSGGRRRDAHGQSRRGHGRPGRGPHRTRLGARGPVSDGVSPSGHRPRPELSGPLRPAVFHPPRRRAHRGAAAHLIREPDPLALGKRRRLRSPPRDAPERHLPFGTDGSGKQESRRGSCRAPVFLPPCFPDSHSDLCFHQSQRGPAPAASHTTSDRPRRGPGVMGVGGHGLRGSADWQSAVSRVGNPLEVDVSRGNGSPPPRPATRRR